LILLRNRGFFGRGEVVVFHWDDCCFVSGSYLRFVTSNGVGE
jgi:hypothetical protein